MTTSDERYEYGPVIPAAEMRDEDLDGERLWQWRQRGRPWHVVFTYSNPEYINRSLDALEEWREAFPAPRCGDDAAVSTVDRVAEDGFRYGPVIAARYMKSEYFDGQRLWQRRHPVKSLEWVASPSTAWSIHDVLTSVPEEWREAFPVSRCGDDAKTTSPNFIDRLRKFSSWAAACGSLSRTSASTTSVQSSFADPTRRAGDLRRYGPVIPAAEMRPEHFSGRRRWQWRYTEYPYRSDWCAPGLWRSWSWSSVRTDPQLGEEWRELFPVGTERGTGPSGQPAAGANDTGGAGDECSYGPVIPAEEMRAEYFDGRRCWQWRSPHSIGWSSGSVSYTLCDVAEGESWREVFRAASRGVGADDECSYGPVIPAAEMRPEYFDGRRCWQRASRIAGPWTDPWRGWALSEQESCVGYWREVFDDPAPDDGAGGERYGPAIPAEEMRAEYFDGRRCWQWRSPHSVGWSSGSATYELRDVAAGESWRELFRADSRGDAGGCGERPDVRDHGVVGHPPGASLYEVAARDVVPGMVAALGTVVRAERRPGYIEFAYRNRYGVITAASAPGDAVVVSLPGPSPRETSCTCLSDDAWLDRYSASDREGWVAAVDPADHLPGCPVAPTPEHGGMRLWPAGPDVSWIRRRGRWECSRGDRCVGGITDSVLENWDVWWVVATDGDAAPGALAGARDLVLRSFYYPPASPDVPAKRDRRVGWDPELLG